MLLALRRIPNPPHAFRRQDDTRPRKPCAEQAVEAGHIHCIFEAVVGKQKRVKFLDLLIDQRPGFDRSHWSAPFDHEAWLCGLMRSIGPRTGRGHVEQKNWPSE